MATETKIVTLYQGIDSDTQQAIAPRTKTSAVSDNDGKGLDAVISELKGSIGNLTLGIASDGFIYIFVDGEPQGAGIPQNTGVTADVYGYVDENNTIVLTGNLVDGTYSIKYEIEDGSLVDIGTLTKTDEEDESKYTNLADPTSADWQEGYRLSISSGGTSALDGHTTTNYIPCKKGDVLRVKGMDIVNENAASGSTSQKFVVYNSNKGKLGGLYGVTSGTLVDGYGKMVAIDGDISTYTIMINNAGGQSTSTEIAYIRLDGVLMNGYTKNDVIITINQEITE